MMNVQGQWYLPWMGTTAAMPGAATISAQAAVQQMSPAYPGTIQGTMANPAPGSYYPGTLTLPQYASLSAAVTQSKMMLQNTLTTSTPAATTQQYQQQQQQQHHQAVVAALAAQQQQQQQQQQQYYTSPTATGYPSFHSLAAFHPSSLLALASPATLSALGLSPVSGHHHGHVTSGHVSSGQTGNHHQVGLTSPHNMFSVSPSMASAIVAAASATKTPLLKTPTCLKVKFFTILLLYIFSYVNRRMS